MHDIVYFHLKEKAQDSDQPFLIQECGYNIEHEEYIEHEENVICCKTNGTTVYT